MRVVVAAAAAAAVEEESRELAGSGGRCIDLATKKPTSCEQWNQIEHVGSSSSDCCCVMPMPSSPLHEFIAIDGSGHFFDVISSSPTHIPYSFPPPFFYLLCVTLYPILFLGFFDLGPVMANGDGVMVGRLRMKDLWEPSLVEEEALRLLEVRFGGPTKHWIDAIPIGRRRCTDLATEKHTPCELSRLRS